MTIITNLNREREWDEIDEGKGWIKLRHYGSGQVLQASLDGQKFSVNDNLNPCQGRKPCIRYIF